MSKFLKLRSFLSQKNKWLALFFISLSLAIVIIDNIIFNISVPYIIFDVGASINGIQWVISGYSLIMAMLLLPMSRLSDIYGRKRIFIIGATLFGVGSLLASFAKSTQILFIGESLMEAIGAAMMLPASLAILVNEFKGRERAIAFSIWGSIAGAAAALGPLLGGWLTTYYSWRWSLRINVFVALVTIIGSVFIKNSKSDIKKGLDWMGVVSSSLGLLSLVFVLIEGRQLGWWTPHETLRIFNWQWSLQYVSIIPFAILSSLFFISLFVFWEYSNSKKTNSSPLIPLEIFKKRDFSFGVLILSLVTLSQFGVFLVLPIFIQTVMGHDAFSTGILFMYLAISAFFAGPISMLLTRKISYQLLINIGITFLLIGTYLLFRVIGVDTGDRDILIGLIIFGMGVGISSSQLTNLIVSSVSEDRIGEVSGLNSVFRQLGTSLGVAIIGSVFASSVILNVQHNIQNDPLVPDFYKTVISFGIEKISFENRWWVDTNRSADSFTGEVIAKNMKLSFVSATQSALKVTFCFIGLALISSIFYSFPRKRGSINPAPFSGVLTPLKEFLDPPSSPQQATGFSGKVRDKLKRHL